MLFENSYVLMPNRDDYGIKITPCEDLNSGRTNLQISADGEAGANLNNTEKDAKYR